MSNVVFTGETRNALIGYLRSLKLWSILSEKEYEDLVQKARDRLKEEEEYQARIKAKENG